MYNYKIRESIIIQAMGVPSYVPKSLHKHQSKSLLYNSSPRHIPPNPMHMNVLRPRRVFPLSHCIDLLISHLPPSLPDFNIQVRL